MLHTAITSVRAALRFRDYKTHHPVCFSRAYKWLNQFNKTERKALASLLDRIVFLNEEKATRLLVQANQKLLERLNSAGIACKNIIYVQFDDAGSSSAATLNILRDRALLQAKGVHFIDSNNLIKLNKLTDELAEGAIIYVDDFIGSGDQFKDAQWAMRPNVIGNFPEFLLATCVCEEAFTSLKRTGVEIIPGISHLKKDRPLNNECKNFPVETRSILRELCRKMDKMGLEGLGHKQMAAMVVLYRNTPDNCPLAFRGSQGQSPIFGLLPRTTDYKIITT